MGAYRGFELVDNAPITSPTWWPLWCKLKEVGCNWWEIGKMTQDRRR